MQLQRKLHRLIRQEQYLMLSLDLVRVQQKLTEQRLRLLELLLAEMEGSEQMRLLDQVPEPPTGLTEIDLYLGLSTPPD